MKLRGFLFTVLILLLVTTAAYGANGSPAASHHGSSETSVQLDGLQGEVTVRYDGFGIPHIYGTTDHDIIMAQGFVTAQDRWWQMEWSRRQASGEAVKNRGARRQAR